MGGWTRRLGRRRRGADSAPVADPESVARQLHADHAAPLFGYVVRLTHDHHWAQDIVQETLVRAVDDDGLRGESSERIRAWMVVVARNLAIDGFRSARRRRELQVGEVPPQWDDDRVDAVLDEWLVTDALAELSDDHRAVIVRAYYGGMTATEIAMALHVPVGTVKSRLHYGLRALRLALQERGVTRQ